MIITHVQHVAESKLAHIFIVIFLVSYVFYLHVGICAVLVQSTYSDLLRAQNVLGRPLAPAPFVDIKGIF